MLDVDGALVIGLAAMDLFAGRSDAGFVARAAGAGFESSDIVFARRETARVDALVALVEHARTARWMLALDAVVSAPKAARLP